MSLHIKTENKKTKKIVGKLLMPCVYYTGRTTGMQEIVTDAGNKYKFLKGTGVKITEPVVRQDDLLFFKGHSQYAVCIDRKHLSEDAYTPIEKEIKKSLKLVRSWKVEDLTKPPEPIPDTIPVPPANKPDNKKK